jgi:hypothetical protein
MPAMFDKRKNFNLKERAAEPYIEKRRLQHVNH